MSETVEFETPENITVNYELAGPGTRFVAWVFDVLLIIIGCILTLLVLGLMASLVDVWLLGDVGDAAGALVVALAVFLIGSSTILYFLLFEFFMHGQTPGKRSVKIRVVRADGFSLTFGSLFIRNIFRVLDSVPLLWVVPLLSSRTQRFGDMAGGTVVVTDHPPETESAQMRLLRRGAAAGLFSFSGAGLDCIEEKDARAIEAYLERCPSMTEAQAYDMGRRLAAAFAERMRMQDIHDRSQCRQFLEDLLAAYYQRQIRELE